MNKWVGCISSVCGLTLKVEDDHSTSIPSSEIIEPVTSPPLLPSADNDADTVSHKDSSPYILISECFTGKPLPNWPLSVDNTLNYSYPKRESFHLPFLDAQYDYPRSSCLQDKQDAPFSTNFVHELYQVPPPPRICEGNFCNKIYSYPNSSSSDDSHDIQTFEGVNLGNNIFMYNSGPAIYHDNSDIETVRKEALRLAQQLESLGIDDSGVENKNLDLPQNSAEHCTDKMCFQNNNVDLSAEVILPPPRPPKPPDLHRKKGENLIPVSRQNDVFDFAVHPKNTCTYADDCQLVTKAGEIIDNHALQLESDISPTLLDDMYDVPKPRSEDSLTILLTGNGTHSRARRNIHVYDNAPPAYTKSSLLTYETKLSTLTLDSELETSVNCLAEQLVEHNTKDIDSTKKCYDSPPMVDRKLKPKRTICENNVEKIGQAIIYPSGPKHCPTEDLYNCGETEQDKRNNDLDTTVEKPLLSKTNEIQYLDLNLDGSTSSKEVTKPEGSQLKRTTVYKTVDFLRTEAFNKMRQNVEAVYRSSH